MSNYKVTILSPTKRWGGIDILLHSLKRQTFQDFQCILLDEHYDARYDEIVQYFDKEWPGIYGDKFIHIKPLPKKSHQYWNLDQALNHGLCLAGGEIIVFWQDYIWAPADGLEKFVKRIEQMGDCLISGVGHKACEPSWAVDLQGKISIFTDYSTPNRCEISERDKHWGWDKPEGIYYQDPRVRGGGFTPTNPIEWESNYAATTKKVCEAIGGFDEDFDAGWGFDNVNFAERAQAAGYEIWLDEQNIHVGFTHELLFHEEKAKQEAPKNVNMWEPKCEGLQRGQLPFKVPFLEEARENLKLGVVA